MPGVQAHLHHTLNCLVGPGGDGFDAKQMNPCAQAGNGAIPDAKDAKPDPTKVKVKGDDLDGDEETEPNEPELVK